MHIKYIGLNDGWNDMRRYRSVNRNFISAKAEVMRSGRSACNCVCMQHHAKSYSHGFAWFFLSKVDLSPALRRLHLGCDPDWPSLSFRGHSRPARSFRLKIDCSRRNGKRYSQRYYIALIGSRMYSVQWRHPRWPCSSFQGQTRRRYVAPWKTISRETYVCGSGRQQWCPTCFLPRVQLSSWDFGLGGGLRSLMCWLRDLNLCYFNPLDSRGNYSATWNNTN